MRSYLTVENVVKNSKGSSSKEFSNKEVLVEGTDWASGRKENAPPAGFSCHHVNQPSIMAHTCLSAPHKETN